MLKFLRRYKTWILVVGGSLLMVAFLLPQALQELASNPADVTVMRVDGKRFTMRDLDMAAREQKALSDISFRALSGFLGESADHWLLLAREAEQGGFVGGPSEVESIFPTLARDIVTMRYSGFGLPPEFFMNQPQFAQEIEQTHAAMRAAMPAVAAGARMTDEELRRAIARMSGVMRMLSAYSQSERFSDRRAIIEARNRADAAGIDYVFIPADLTAAAVPDPDDAAIQSHIDRFKGVREGEGEFGIGYLLPERLRLVTIALDRAAIAAGSEPDALEVEKRFRRNFPTGQAPSGDARTPEQLREEVRSQVRSEAAEKAMKTAMEAVRSEFAPALRTLEEETDYKRLPADWNTRLPDFDRAAAMVVSRLRDMHGISIPTPVVTRMDSGWLERTDVAALPGIGQSVVQFGSRNVPFVDYLFRVRELAGPNETLVQVGIPAQEATIDSAGNRFFFMVLDVRPESNPDTWDELRPQIVRDYKRLTAFEALAARVPALRQTAVEQGLEAVALSEGPAADAEGKVRTTLPVRQATFNRAVSQLTDSNLNDPAFRAMVLDAASQLDPTKPLDSAPDADRIVASAIPRSLGAVVARISSFTPLTIEEYRRRQGAIVRTLQQEGRQRSEAAGPYTRSELIRRHKVQFDGREDEGASPDAPAPNRAG